MTISQCCLSMLLTYRWASLFTRKNPFARKRYTSIEKDALDLDGTIMKFAGQRWIALQRITGGNEKVKLFKSVLNTLQSEQLVVWCRFTEEVDRLHSAFPDSRILDKRTKQVDRPKLLSDFKNHKFRFIFGQPETIKFGSKIEGVKTVIFFSAPFGLMTRQQVEKRSIQLYGNNARTLVYDLICTDTVDEDNLLSLHAKETNEQLGKRMIRSAKRRLGID